MTTIQINSDFMMNDINSYKCDFDFNDNFSYISNNDKVNDENIFDTLDYSNDIIDSDFNNDLQYQTKDNMIKINNWNLQIKHKNEELKTSNTSNNIIKKSITKLKNRISAQISRDKKKNYILNLEKENILLKNEVSKLYKKIDNLESKNESLMTKFLEKSTDSENSDISKDNILIKRTYNDNLSKNNKSNSTIYSVFLIFIICLCCIFNKTDYNSNNQFTLKSGIVPLMNYKKSKSVKLIALKNFCKHHCNEKLKLVENEIDKYKLLINLFLKPKINQDNIYFNNNYNKLIENKFENNFYKNDKILFNCYNKDHYKKISMTKIVNFNEKIILKLFI